MNPPFTVEAFLGVFAQYNAAIWPVQIGAYLMGLVVLLAVFAAQHSIQRLACAALAVLWAFIGIGYHLMFFAAINPIAPVFSGFFVLEALLLLASAFRPGNLSLKIVLNLRSVAGLAVIVYALLVYPLLSLQAGHGLMAGPMFGVAPCPTTIFTIGILLIARGRWVIWLSIIPILWALVGLAAAVQLGIAEDLGLPVVGVILATFLAVQATLDRAALRLVTRGLP